MRKLAQRPLTLALSLLLLGVLGAYGLGLTHGQPARGDTTPLGNARLLLHDLCAPHHTVCGQMVPGVLGATLLIGMARVRDGLGTTATLTTNDHAAANATPDARSAAPTAETLLGLVALVLACCWLTTAPRAPRLVVTSPTLLTRSIPAHLCTPAP